MNHKYLLTLLAFLILINSAFAGWGCEAIEVSGDIGKYTSLLEGTDENFHISHEDETNDDLRYCEGSFQNWTCEAVETANDVGKFSSMVEGADGNFHISHLDDSTDDLRYCEGTIGDWACETVDSTGNVGYWTDIIEGADNNFHISHEDFSGNDKLHYCEGTMGDWTCQVVHDSAVYSLLYSQTAILEGADTNLHILFSSITHNLQYCEGTGNTNWTCQQIDYVGSGNGQDETDLIEGTDGNLHIVHEDNITNHLRYCEGTSDANWVCKAIDTSTDVGSYPTILEGADTNLHITHYDDSTNDLRYCYGNWDDNFTCQTIESQNDVGQMGYLIEATAGNLIISYRGNTGLDLRYCVEDNTAPTTGWDGNVSWQNVDANVTLTCNESDTNCASTRYRLDTDATSTVSYGTWTTYDANIFVGNDGNWAVDFNSTDYASNIGDTNTFYILVDSTTPATPTITTPTAPHLPDINLTYSATDATSGIKKYWISLTGTNYTDNGTATTYTTACGHTSRTFYLKATDNADNNSNTTTTTFSCLGGGEEPRCGDNECNGSETAATCPGDCSPKCGDNVCTGTESIETCPLDCVGCGDGKCDDTENCETCETDCGECEQEGEKILEQTTEKQPTQEQIDLVLKEAGLGEQAKQKATEAIGKIEAKRNIVVTQISQDNTTKYKTKIKLIIKNKTQKRMQNIEIIEQIPKQIAANANLVKSNHEFEILKTDPIIRFNIPQTRVGEQTEIVYTIETRAEENTIQQWTPPIITNFQETKPLPTECNTNADCEDNNPCTTKKCLNQNCSYIPKTDGTSCGYGSTCKQSQCKETAGIISGGTIAGINTIIVAAGIIIIATATYTIYSIYLKQ